MASHRRCKSTHPDRRRCRSQGMDQSFAHPSNACTHRACVTRSNSFRRRPIANRQKMIVTPMLQRAGRRLNAHANSPESPTSSGHGKKKSSSDTNFFTSLSERNSTSGHLPVAAANLGHCAGSGFKRPGVGSYHASHRGGPPSVQNGRSPLGMRLSALDRVKGASFGGHAVRSTELTCRDVCCGLFGFVHRRRLQDAGGDPGG